MITAQDLVKVAKMRCTMSLEMDGDAYERHYQSDEHPRFRMIDYAGPKDGITGRQVRSMKLMVDFVPCVDMDEVTAMLSVPPVKVLTALMEAR